MIECCTHIILDFSKSTRIGNIDEINLFVVWPSYNKSTVTSFIIPIDYMYTYKCNNNNKIIIPLAKSLKYADISQHTIRIHPEHFIYL